MPCPAAETSTLGAELTAPLHTDVVASVRTLGGNSLVNKEQYARAVRVVHVPTVHRGSDFKDL